MFFFFCVWDNVSSKGTLWTLKVWWDSLWNHLGGLWALWVWFLDNILWNDRYKLSISTGVNYDKSCFSWEVITTLNFSNVSVEFCLSFMFLKNSCISVVISSLSLLILCLCFPRFSWLVSLVVFFFSQVIDISVSLLVPLFLIFPIIDN